MCPADHGIDIDLVFTAAPFLGCELPVDNRPLSRIALTMGERYPRLDKVCSNRMGRRIDRKKKGLTLGAERRRLEIAKSRIFFSSDHRALQAPRVYGAFSLHGPPFDNVDIVWSVRFSVSHQCRVNACDNLYVFLTQLRQVLRDCHEHGVLAG